MWPPWVTIPYFCVYTVFSSVALIAPTVCLIPVISTMAEPKLAGIHSDLTQMI